MNENDNALFKQYGVDKVNVGDILMLFRSNDERFTEWYENRPDEWWETFFSCLLESQNYITNIDAVKKEAKIFLIDNKRQ